MPDGLSVRQHRAAARVAEPPHDQGLAGPQGSRAAVHRAQRGTHDRHGSGLLRAALSTSIRSIPSSPCSTSTRPSARRSSPTRGRWSRHTSAWKTRRRFARSVSNCASRPRSASWRCAASSIDSSSTATVAWSSPTTRPVGLPGLKYEQGRLAGVHFYSFLCEEVLGRRPSAIRLMYLRTGETITALPSAQSVKFITTRTTAVWKAVERACTTGTFLPRQGPLCTSCSFQQWCPAFGGDPELAAVEAPLQHAALVA